MAFNSIKPINNAITDIASYLDNKSSAIVRPKTSPGISGFVFDIPQRESVEHTSEITDNYTEDNSFLHDHRVIKPVIIELSGLIGELIISQDTFDDILQTLRTGLYQLEAFTGDYTSGMTQSINRGLSQAEQQAAKIKQLVDRTKNIVGAFSGETQGRNRQQEAYDNIKALYVNSSLLTVQTPWAYFDSMLIETLTFEQDETTEEITNVSVTLKEVRFAKIGIEDFSQYTEADRQSIQKQVKEQVGKAGGKPLNRSTYKKAFLKGKTIVESIGG